MPTRLDKFNTWSNGNVVSTRYAHDVAVGAIQHAQRSSMSGTATTAGVNLTKQIAVNTKNGVVTATASQKISARQIAKALRVASSGPLGLALLAAPAIIELLDDAGLEHVDGQFMVPAPGSCTSSPCYEWAHEPGFPYHRTPELAAQSAIGATKAGCGTVSGVAGVGLAGGGFPNYYANYVCSPNPNPQGPYGISPRLRTPDTSPVLQPATEQQIEDKLTAANPSPEVLRDLVQIGDVVPAADPSDATSMSSPQPSPTKTTTKTNPDGSTETTECRTVGTVSGADLRLAENCTTTHRNSSGTVTGVTTVNSDQADPEPTPQEQEEPSPLCEMFPNILACAEFGDPDGDEIPRGERSVSFSPEVLFGSGSCPADKTITAQGLTITVGQWSTWCPYITTYMRPIVLLLAAFAALMIVLKGVEE